MRLPLDEFRTFIALHEATHAFEFEAYPWLRDHFAGLVAETIDQLAADSGRHRPRGCAAPWRDAGRATGWSG